MKSVIATHELGVLFFQVGSDEEATEFLEGLDDRLRGVKVDFIDHKPIDDLSSEDSVRECFVDAFFD